MDEVGEVPNKEQVIVSPELSKKMAEATGAVSAELNNPEAQIANPAGQLSLFAELGQLGKEQSVKRLGILFKDVKAVIGFIPFAPMVGEKLGMKPYSELMQEVKGAGGVSSAVSSLEHQKAKAEKQLKKATERVEKAGSGGLTKALEAQTKARTALDGIQSQLAGKQAELTRNAGAIEARMNAKKDELGITDGAQFDTWKDRVWRKVKHIAGAPWTDKELIGRGHEVAEHFKDAKVPPTEAQRLYALGNGDMPPRTKLERFGRNVKVVGGNVILANLGPITDLAPDVPGLVRLGTLGAALLGFPEVGVVEPVWQFLHNRYEEIMTTIDISKRSYEIVKRHWDQRMDKLNEPNVAKAAAVFEPKKET